MNKTHFRFGRILGVVVCVCLLFPKQAQAVIPPDFIFNIGTQLVQFFSIIFVFVTALFGAVFQFFRIQLQVLRHKKIVIVGSVVGAVGVISVFTFVYGQYLQQRAYEQWLQKSQENAQRYMTSSSPFGSGEESVMDSNDQLIVGGYDELQIDRSSLRFVSDISQTDSVSQFIVGYYKHIAEGDFDQAYAMSKQVVDPATFAGWYAQTTKITLDKLVRIDERKSSIELTLFEGESFTRYGVLMTLVFKDAVPIRVESSQVRILAQGAVEQHSVTVDASGLNTEYDFFEQNQSYDLVVTNDTFSQMRSTSAADIFVLDARENIEYENGYLPGSTHIRFADLKAGRWIEVPNDKIVVVLCWSGMRGKEVAEFLRTKKIVASYLEKGASDWVQFGGAWVGDITFAQAYPEERYQKLLNTNAIKQRVGEGVVLVDTREPAVYRRSHIEGSVNIPILYAPTIRMDEVFAQVPANSTVVTVCDGYVNCFDAKLTGVELERRGHTFLGRYNSPWEYDE